MTRESIRITVLGCGDAFSSGGREQTCFHVRAPGGAFLIDCGASAVAGLKRRGLNPRDIDTIFISHFHGDHYGGLPYFLLDAAASGREEPLTILSPPGGRKKTAALLDLLYPGTPVLDRLRLRFIDYASGQELTAGYLSLTAYSVTHVPATDPHGLRIKVADKVIAYSGDTAWHPHLPVLAGGADLFICECNFFGTQSDTHIDYQTLEARRETFGCRRLLLTHLGGEMLSRLEEVNLPCAADGMVIEV